jgi:Protein of unknown function (DUF4241)
MSWLNGPAWKALADGERFAIDGRNFALSVIGCGDLRVPSGRLVACDPFAAMSQHGNAEIAIPPGTYPVRVTLADVSDTSDGSHVREAYASLILSDQPEVERHLLTPLQAGATAPELGPDEFVGFGVDAGTACFVDAAALEYGMPDERSWDELFDNGTDDSWFSRMDDPHHIREGIANILLPLATDGTNLILFHSGWGDGAYPIIGGYDRAGILVAVHIDFFIIPDPTELSETESGTK